METISAKKKKPLPWKWVFIAAVLFVGMTAVMKDFLILTALRAAIRAGQLNIEIDQIHVSFLRTLIRAEGLRIYNPREFPEGIALDIPRLTINWKVGSTLITGTTHLKEVRLELKTLQFVRNEEGQMNLALIKFPQAPLKVDSILLELPEVVFKDYTHPIVPLERQFPVNIHEKYEDLTDLKDLNGILQWVILKAVRNASVSRFLNLNPADFMKANLLDTLWVSHKLVGTGKNLVVGTLKTGVVAPIKWVPLPEKDAEKEIMQAEQKLEESEEGIEAFKESVESFKTEIDETRKELRAGRTQLTEAAKDLQAKENLLEEKRMHWQTQLAEFERMRESSGIRVEELERRQAELKNIEQEMDNEARALEALNKSFENQAQFTEKTEEEVKKAEMQMEESAVQLKDFKQKQDRLMDESKQIQNANGGSEK